MSKGSSWLIGAALVAGLLCTDTAAAQGRARVAVVSVQGPQARKIQGYIEGALRREVELVAVGNASPRSDADFAALAAEHELQAIVTAQITKQRLTEVTVTVRQGSDGREVGSQQWAHRKPAKLSVIQRELWSKLRSAIENAEAASAPEPTPAPTRTTTTQTPTRTTPSLPSGPEDDESDDAELADEDSDSPRTGKRRPALRVELGFGPMWRDQAYNDTLREVPFRYYNEVGSPAMWLALSAAWYPVALASDSALGNIGLVAGFGTALGLSSSSEDGTEIDTSASAFQLGLRGRLPVDRSELGLTIAYGGRSFSTDANAATPIPDVGHRFLRLAADGHIAIGQALALELNAGYLLRLKSGELESAEYFPNLGGGGVEFGIAGVYAFGDSGLSARLGLDWQRFFFSLNPAEDADRVAGGAVDNYYTLNVALRYELTTH